MDEVDGRGATRSGEWILEAPGPDAMLIDLLERVAVNQEYSASVLRMYGNLSGAARASRAASQITLYLSDPRSVTRMHDLVRAVRERQRFDELLERALEGAMSLVGADFGNIQLVHAPTNTLRIACSCEFGSDFLEYFAVVDRDATSACGRAALRQSQTVIPDVATDDGFRPHLEVAAAAGFRAVQSTPLVDSTGCMVGVVSTHFRRPCRPPERVLQLMEWYGERIGSVVAAARQGEISVTSRS